MSFGGFIGAALGIFVWKVRRKLPVSHLSDVVAWVFPFGWIFGRMGCFVVHDHPGAQTTFFLGVEGWEGQAGVIRHDLGLYEVFWSILVFSIFWSMRKMKNRPTGLFVALLPLFYTPYRFGLDFLRATDVSNPDTRFWNHDARPLRGDGLLPLQPRVPDVGASSRHRGDSSRAPLADWSSVAAETEERPKAEPSRTGKKVKRKRA
ncbi:MAG: prolipoprotein diacylglyceryl transferase [Polyangiales bacterium]